MSSMYSPPGGPPPRRCLRCGMPLLANAVNCGQCGAYNAIPQPNGPVQSTANFNPQWGGGQARPDSTGSGQYPGSWGPPPMPPMQNVPSQSMPAGNTYMPQSSQFNGPSQQLPFPGQNFGQPSSFQQAYIHNNGIAPQQNPFARSPSATLGGIQPGGMNGNGIAFNDYEQSYEEKRGPRVGLIIGIVLLLIVLIGGGFAGFTFVKNQAQNNNTASVTTKPVVITTPTVKPLFSDTFAKNSAGWDLTSNPGKFLVKIGNGSMTLEDDENRLLPEVIPNKSFSDFRLDVDATLTKGDRNNGYGVYIRGGSSQDSVLLGTYYRFELYGDGTYALFKGTLDSSGNSQSVKVQDYSQNAAIKPEGDINHITIIANGPDMTFMVNGQTLYKYHDTSYKDGSVALFVSNLPKLTPGAQATFSNLAIFPPT